MCSCYICGNYIDEPKIDWRDKKLEPCDECKREVEQIVREYDEDYIFTEVDNVEEISIEREERLLYHEGLV